MLVRNLFLTLLVIAALAQVSSVASAAAEKNHATEFFFQPGASESAVDIRVSYLMTNSIQLKLPTGADVGTAKIDATVFGARYFYGLSENHALGIKFDYGTVNSKQDLVSPAPSGTSKSSGLGDIFLSYAAVFKMDGWAFHFGGDLGVSPGKHKNSDLNNEGDRYSGGMSVSPYVGARYFASDMFSLGARATYIMKLERTEVDQSVTPNVETKVTGESELEFLPFAEWNHGKGFVDVYLGPVSRGSATYNTAGTETTLGSSSSFRYGVIGSYDFSDSFTGIFEYVGESVSSKASGAGIQPISFTASTFNLSGRFHF